MEKYEIGDMDEFLAFCADQEAKLTGATFWSRAFTKPFCSGHFKTLYQENGDESITVWHDIAADGLHKWCVA